MNKEVIKYRVIGVAVIIALFVILYPLLKPNKPLPSETKMPAFNMPLPPGSPQVKAPAKMEQALSLSPQSIPVPPQQTEPFSEANPPLPVSHITNAALTQPKKPQPPTHKAAKQTSQHSPKKLAMKLPAHKQNMTQPSTDQIFGVQVASFSHLSNAKILGKKMKTKDFPVFIQRVVSAKGKTLYRLVLGPKANRQAAERLQKQVLAKFNIKGMLIHLQGKTALNLV